MTHLSRNRAADCRDSYPASCRSHLACHILLSVRSSVSPVPEMSQQAAPIAPTMANRKDGDENGTGLGLATRTRTRTKKPSPYKVLMLNDDYTPMEFVVLCLQRFFRMNIEDATRVMLHVHQKGVGVCGVFSYEVAETKVSQVVDFARQNQHPLQCTLEKA